MMSAVAAGGRAVGVLADSLETAALSGKFRTSLARGSLTLISMAGAAAHFSVGLAMARNQYIYTLADAAVVVHSGRKGGTWTGAKECISKGWIPVYVRDLKDAHLGNASLLTLRGNVRPLPADRFDRDVRNLLTEPRPSDARAPVQRGLFGPSEAREQPVPFGARKEVVGDRREPAPVLAELSPASAEHFYELFHRFMNGFATEPRSLTAIVRQSGLVQSQAKHWLARALGDGWLRKHGRPALYVLASVATPPPTQAPSRRRPRVR